MVTILRKYIYYSIFFPYYKIRLGRLGKRSMILSCKFSKHKNIFIGKNVFISSYGWLAAEPVTGNKNCKLIIDDGTYIGRFTHIYASSSVTIGKKVLIADKVYISDNLHSFENINLPVIDQPVKQTEAVVINDGAWLGENVCVIGASVGKNAVIGANAVVTKSIPDFCVAVGTPATIIKRYNHETGKWQKTDTEGNFIVE